jgi:hypothetical protein
MKRRPGWLVSRLAAAALSLVLAGVPAMVRATPLDFIPVGDPLEDELRILDVLGPSDSLRHLSMRPLQVIEIPALDGEPPSPAAAIAIGRLRRSLARDRAIPFEVPGSSPRLLQLVYPDHQRLDLSVGLEGSGMVARGSDPDFSSPSGLHLRAGALIEHWVVHTHLTAGAVERGLRFASALVPGSDAVLHSEQAYLGYTDEKARWSVQMGRSRWHWGPGDEASLLLSKTSVPLTGMALHLRIAPLRADGMVFSATIDQAAEEQLAAHRLEWQPIDALRIGMSEAVRYRSPRWEPLYWVGVLPYTLVQNLLLQDTPDSAAALRNNVQVALDAAWRVAPGHRAYGELLIDDLRTRDVPSVSKFAYLLGWESAISSGRGRFAWGAELARISRFVYTSFFGRRYVAQDRPIGHPLGPDSRRVRLRGSWDPHGDWQIAGAVSHTEVGESGLDVPYVPTSPRVSVMRFLGVVEQTSEVELGVRFWPASGIDLGLRGGARWVEDAGHVEGAHRSEPWGELRVRLVR